MVDKLYDLLEAMEDELEEAEEYAVRAAECSKSHTGNKSTYISMAEDELGHFEKLNEMLKSHTTDIGEDLKWFVEKSIWKCLKSMEILSICCLQFHNFFVKKAVKK